MTLIKLSDTTHPVDLLMIDSTDHLAGKTGLTLTITLSKNGGAFAAGGGSVVDRGSGWYAWTPASGDVGTLGELSIHVTGTGADPTDAVRQVVAFDPYDTVRFGLTALPNVAAGANGGLPTGDASGRVTVGALAAAVITAASIATDAIDNDAWAADLDPVIAAAALNAAAASFNIAGSIGQKINSAGTAGDPLTAAVPGAYGAGTAGAALGRVDVAVSSRNAVAPDNATIAAIAALIDTEVAAILAKTNLIPASPAAVGSAMTLSLAQTVPDGQTIGTVGRAFEGMDAQSEGAWSLSPDGLTLTLKRRNGTTFRTFTLDAAPPNTTSRT